MSDLRRYSIAAVVLIVILRLSIGWQLLYEGLWKIDTLKTPRPWTSAGYLKNAVGPLRDNFRNMAGDPDDLGWLDYDIVSSRWKSWAETFKKHYNLTEKQAKDLDGKLYGRLSNVGKKKAFAESLEALPEGVDKLNVSKDVVWFDPGKKQLYVNAAKMMTPGDKARLERLIDGRDDDGAVAFQRTLDRLYDRQKKTMGYLRKLSGALKGDPDLLGNEDWQRLGKLDQYKQQLAQYEKEYAVATTPFEWDHLKHTWSEIQTLRSEITGPVKALEADLKDEAVALLTIEQQAEGPVPAPWTTVRMADTATILGLTVLGTMLMLGLFTRFAALAAAFMLFNFYLAMPPFPGLPPIPGPEHSFIVNKNLIEVIALLAIACVPSGMWFGVDRLLSVFFANWKADKQVSSSRKSMVATGDEPTELAAAT